MTEPNNQVQKGQQSPRKVELVLVIFPRRDEKYSYFKKAGETKYGIKTQCVLAKQVTTLLFYYKNTMVSRQFILFVDYLIFTPSTVLLNRPPLFLYPSCSPSPCKVVGKFGKGPDQQTLGNLLQKINTKTGGTNHGIRPEDKPLVRVSTSMMSV